MQTSYVYRGQAQRRQRRHSSSWWGITIIVLGLALVIGLGIILSEPPATSDVILVSDNGVEKKLEDAAAIDETETKKLPAKLDLQNLAETWVNSTAGRESVYIYDLDYGEAIAAVNENDNYNTASLYKLFPVYEGYRRVYNGTWRADETLTAKHVGANCDNAGGCTISDCLDAAIRASDSTCGEALWSKIGRTELDDIIKTDYGITNSRISGLLSNPVDIAKILEHFYYHPDFDLETFNTFLHSALDQPPVNNGLCSGVCVWRQGLPAGLASDQTLVYDKVGWLRDGTSYWSYYHDAALVYSGDHHLVIVVMSSDIPSFSEITTFGTQLRGILEGQ